jgi:hypothetical protein
MTALIILIFGIAGMLALLRVTHRIAVASEATATIASAIYANMTPEARARADQYLKGLKAK